MKGTCIVIPAKLRKQVELAHEGHQRLCKTKSFLRERFWFPGMDRLVQELLAVYTLSSSNLRKQTGTTHNVTSLPMGENLVDFCGPMPTDEYKLVLIDEYSRHPTVEIIKSTSANKTIPKLTVRLIIVKKENLEYLDILKPNRDLPQKMQLFGQPAGNRTRDFANLVRCSASKICIFRNRSRVGLKIP